MSWMQASRGLGAALLGAVALACGAEEQLEEPRERAGWSRTSPAEDRQPGGNGAPRIDSVRLDPAEPASGGRVRAIVNVNEPDGDPVELGFVWRVGGVVQSETGPEIVLGEATPGVRIEVAVTASDGRTESAPVQAEGRVGNRRPVITRLTLDPGGYVSRGDPLRARAEGRDPNGSQLEYRYQWWVNGERTSEEGSSFETASLRKGDTIRVRVVASDGIDESDPIESAPVRVANGSPEIVSMPSGLLENGVFHYVIEARDPDGDGNLRYRLEKGPEGMTVNPVLGEVTWRPSARQAGTHAVEIVVEDSGGGRGLQSFELDVKAEQQPPAAPRR